MSERKGQKLCAKNLDPYLPCQVGN